MNIIHRLTGVLIDFLYFRLFGLRFCGRENLPEHAPYILLANHRSMGDPFALGEVYRQGVVYFMAKEELFRNPIVRWYITKMHGFPVKRGKADLAAMRTALQVLKDGHVLGIFPEGHAPSRRENRRTGDRDLRAGAQGGCAGCARLSGRGVPRGRKAARSRRQTAGPG